MHDDIENRSIGTYTSLTGDPACILTFRIIANYDADKNVMLINGVVFNCIKEATSHSTLFDIPMCPLREDQIHRHRFTY